MRKKKRLNKSQLQSRECAVTFGQSRALDNLNTCQRSDFFVCLVFKRNVGLCVQTTIHEMKQISKCVDVEKLYGKSYLS